jgi:hypothetical protein
MEKKNKHGLVVVVVVVAIAATAYFIIKSKKGKKEPTTKSEKVNAIIADPISGLDGSNYFDLMSYGDDYISAWYAAVKAVQQYFFLNGLKYNTVGGKRA